MTETTYTESDLIRAHNADTTSEPSDEVVYSKAVMTAFKRAKKASKKNDKQSRKIVKALEKERAKKRPPSPKRKKREQSTIGDFLLSERYLNHWHDR